MTGPRVAQLLAAIDQGYRKKAWHGPNLRGALRGVDPEVAAWRPSPERHNIWELVVHLAYWKHNLIRRFDREVAGSFSEPGSDFFSRPIDDDLDPRAWKRDLAVLDDFHQRFRTIVEGLADDDLDRPAPHSKELVFDLVFGCPAHDVYHAAQIQLLKRMHETETAGGKIAG